MKINAILSRFLLAVMLSAGFIACSDKDKNDDPAPASCIDGLLNQNETGIDCGGICPACPSCSDGIQNQNETGIDCGGICTPCPSCFDGILNQDELGIDCGGICPPCSIPSLTAKVDNISWNAGSGISAQNTPSTKITIIGISTAGTRITINYSGPFVIGSANLGPSFTLEYRDAGGTVYGGISGTISFAQFNTTTKRVSGTFSGQVKDNIGNVTKSVTVGIFSNIGY